jgi:hypothetical protein
MAVRCQQALEGFSREVYEAERIQPPGPAAAGDDRWTGDDAGERSFL